MSKITGLEESPDHLSVVVLGASGDLAKKKTFPALFALSCLGLLPKKFTVFGFARSKLTDDQLRESFSTNLKEWPERKAEFLKRVHYINGAYDASDGFKRLNDALQKEETDAPKANRLFYFAVPPSVYINASKNIAATCVSKTGWNRFIYEKPFGSDLDSAQKLNEELLKLFDDRQIFRIDHYLGKEMVQNLLAIRFANEVYEPLWNRQHVANVTMAFKEDFGIGGRAGYFEQAGLARDVMQNHMMQMLAMMAIETPVTLAGDDIRDERERLFRSCRELSIDETVVGQYGASDGHKAYVDEEGVPKNSKTPTFVASVVHIDNPRWKDVPFILTCGKGLDVRKSEIRIQFKKQPNVLFPKTHQNELVIRVSPDEAVYLKFNAKKPGMTDQIIETELDLSFRQRFDERIPDAYERLLLEALKGDQSQFVRADELFATWRIFTPLLHEMDSGKLEPIIYPFGSRGPKEADDLKMRYGFTLSKDYEWPGPKKLSEKSDRKADAKAEV